ncbi:hypothetical protein C8D92_103284 [Tamilnaduibacter salinus]|uniref:Zinc ribbon protein n=1 Tax=Tamilnaduibacter salinus TaxID=1484056 RepID=A0A2A2I6Y9_9GAMM|nr:hypothetical protein [Tamilnaduibacter salinus]PAV27066.1 hypothetical protein CF392_02710 [Tamilnaduibacter salinus]PVY77597.1 hypothetical protein C8D92_103284 [Tamilnaduibacter salinus]
MSHDTRYLTPEQDQQVRRWERWNFRYFLFAFAALLTLLVFSSMLGLSSGREWGPLGLLLALVIVPIIILQYRLVCPACEQRIGWQAKLMAPQQCRQCGVFLRAKAHSK